MNIRVRANYWLGLLWLVLCAGRATAATPSVTAAGEPAAPVSLDGLWRGQLAVPGGQLELIFRLVKLTNGTYFGTFEAPQQKLPRTVMKVDVKGDSVSFYAEEASSRFVGRVQPDGKKMEGIWQQPGFKAALTLDHTPPATAAGGKPKLTPPYREEEVVYSNLPAGIKLAGTLTIPAGPGPFPAVVLLSDAGSQDRDGSVGDYAPLGQLADHLTRRGIAVLRYDDRGVGKSEGNPSATIPDIVTDAQAGLQFLRTRPEIDLTQLGLVGTGEGGNVALLAAAAPLPPAFVVTIGASGLPGSDMILQQQTNTLRSLGTEPAQLAAAIKRQQAMIEIIRQTQDNAQAQAIVANMLRQSNAALDAATAQASAAEMTSPRYRYFLDFRPLAKLGLISCPVLLLNGGADLAVNPDENLNALKLALKSSKSVTARKLPGVNHLLQPDQAQWPIVSGQPQPILAPAVQDAVREWITLQTKAKK